MGTAKQTTTKPIKTAPLSLKKAVYAGTFDPITNGHRDIVVRALGVFDIVYVAVAASTSKEVIFSAEERVSLCEGAVEDIGGRVRVESFDGLLVDYVHEVGSSVIIRGIRAVTDYEYEAQLAVTNRHLAPDIETVFLMTSDHTSFISSSIVRQVARFGGDVTQMVPPNVARRLLEMNRKG